MCSAVRLRRLRRTSLKAVDENCREPGDGGLDVDCGAFGRDLRRDEDSRDGRRELTIQRRKAGFEVDERIGNEMAEEEGFEPPIPFQVRQFSRLEPSTTRPLFLLEG